MRPDVVVFLLLAGWGLGLLTALAAHWVAAKLADAIERDPLQGLEVRDSSMDEFDAVARRAA